MRTGARLSAQRRAAPVSIGTAFFVAVVCFALGAVASGSANSSDTRVPTRTDTTTRSVPPTISPTTSLPWNRSYTDTQTFSKSGSLTVPPTPTDTASVSLVESPSPSVLPSPSASPVDSPTPSATDSADTETLELSLSASLAPTPSSSLSESHSLPDTPTSTVSDSRSETDSHELSLSLSDAPPIVVTAGRDSVNEDSVVQALLDEEDGTPLSLAASAERRQWVLRVVDEQWNTLMDQTGLYKLGQQTVGAPPIPSDQPAPSTSTVRTFFYRRMTFTPTGPHASALEPWLARLITAESIIVNNETLIVQLQVVADLVLPASVLDRIPIRIRFEKQLFHRLVEPYVFEFVYFEPSLQRVKRLVHSTVEHAEVVTGLTAAAAGLALALSAAAPASLMMEGSLGAGLFPLNSCEGLSDPFARVMAPPPRIGFGGDPDASITYAVAGCALVNLGWLWAAIAAYIVAAVFVGSLKSFSVADTLRYVRAPGLLALSFVLLPSSVRCGFAVIWSRMLIPTAAHNETAAVLAFALFASWLVVAGAICGLVVFRFGAEKSPHVRDPFALYDEPDSDEELRRKRLEADELAANESKAVKELEAALLSDDDGDDVLLTAAERRARQQERRRRRRLLSKRKARYTRRTDKPPKKKGAFAKAIRRLWIVFRANWVEHRDAYINAFVLKPDATGAPFNSSSDDDDADTFSATNSDDDDGFTAPRRRRRPLHDASPSPLQLLSAAWDDFVHHCFVERFGCFFVGYRWPFRFAFAIELSYVVLVSVMEGAAVAAPLACKDIIPWLTMTVLVGRVVVLAVVMPHNMPFLSVLLAVVDGIRALALFFAALGWIDGSKEPREAGGAFLFLAQYTLLAGLLFQLVWYAVPGLHREGEPEHDGSTAKALVMPTLLGTAGGARKVGFDPFDVKGSPPRSPQRKTGGGTGRSPRSASPLRPSSPSAASGRLRSSHLTHQHATPPTVLSMGHLEQGSPMSVRDSPGYFGTTQSAIIGDGRARPGLARELQGNLVGRSGADGARAAVSIPVRESPPRSPPIGRGNDKGHADDDDGGDGDGGYFEPGGGNADPLRALRFLEDTPSWEGITDDSLVAGRRQSRKGRAPRVYGSSPRRGAVANDSAFAQRRGRLPAGFVDDPDL